MTEFSPLPLILIFFIVSFFAWLLQSLWHSWRRGSFINAGFLAGPWIPAAGAAALLLGILRHRYGCALPELFLASIALVIAGEALFALASRSMLGFLLRDYRERGGIRRALPALLPVFWASVLAPAALVLPALYGALDRAATPGRLAAVLLAMIFSADIAVSLISARNFRRRVEYLILHYFHLTRAQIETLIRPYGRLVRAFPDMERFFAARMEREFGNIVTGVVRGAATRRRTDRREKPTEREFRALIRDILDNPEYGRLREFYHHDSSTFVHALRVAWISYRATKLLGLDYRSAARGAMLHDFYLYDRKRHRKPDLDWWKYHGFEHPRIALRNSRKHFHLNQIERDIIVKHMWPITIIPPRYRESYIVSLADKYSATLEYSAHFARMAGRLFSARGRGGVESGKKY